MVSPSYAAKTRTVDLTRNRLQRSVHRLVIKAGFVHPVAIMKTARRSESGHEPRSPRPKTAEVFLWPNRILTARAERLRDRWGAQFDAGLDPDPFDPGGPWSAEA